MTVIKAVGAVSLIMNLEHPGVSVTYHANAYKLDSSGQRVGLLNANDSLPVGGKVLFTFPADSQFNNTDISWYATGAAFGTPYGQWVYGSGDARVGACSGQPYATGLSITHGTPGNTFDYTSAGLADEYALLSVAPPLRSIQVSGPVSCTDAANGDKTCTLTGEGSVTATYSFAATQGDFYGGMYYYFTRQDFINPANGQQQGCRDFGLLEPAIIVPAQTIKYQIAVVLVSEAPMAPTVTSAASCTVGTPVTLTFTSSDPASHQLKYGVDWDNDGSVDQWVPPSGYVPSGTSQSASRTYAIAGQKSVKVISQNDQGVSSSWTSYTFTCADGSISACPSGYVKQDNECVLSDQCNELPRCSGNYLLDSCTGATIQTCSYGCRSGACVVVAPPSATLHATPSLVRSSNTTSVSWSSSNSASCTVHGTNGNSWAGTSSSGKTSSPIIEQTIYTLHCIGLAGASPSSVDKSVTVNLLPKFSENCSPGFVFEDGHCLPQ